MSVIIVIESVLEQGTGNGKHLNAEKTAPQQHEAHQGR